MWILGSFKRESAFIYLPGILSVIIAILFPDLGETSLIYGLLATALIDSGHVYTTVWRTVFYGEERRSHYLYWAFPLLFFVFFTVWYSSNLPYLWSFVVYSTLYHHVRQVYGFSKWYQALNKRSDKVSDYFLYTLSTLPMIIYHFRPGAVANYYSDKDLFLYPHETIRNTLLLIYASVFSAWIIFEMKLWRSGVKEINRILSVAFPAIVYAYCFLIGKTFSQVLFPLLFIHGVSYCAVMSQTLYRTQSKRFSTPMIAMIVVIATAFIFGLSESWFEENFVGLNDGNASWMTAAIVGMSLTPLYCHYAFDAIIWKRNHRESAMVLKNFPDR